MSEYTEWLSLCEIIKKCKGLSTDGFKILPEGYSLNNMKSIELIIGYTSIGKVYGTDDIMYEFCIAYIKHNWVRWGIKLNKIRTNEVLAWNDSFIDQNATLKKQLDSIIKTFNNE